MLCIHFGGGGWMEEGYKIAFMYNELFFIFFCLYKAELLSYPKNA